MWWTPFILQTLIWIPTRVLFVIFLRFNITGRNNTKGFKKGVIFAMNHMSELDPILLPASLNPFSKIMPMYYVSKDKSAYKHLGIRGTMYGGKFFRLWGAHPVTVGLKNYDKSLARHIKLLEKGKSVCIFPEGRKSDDAGLQEPKGGVVALAKATGRPVVPVAVSGHFKMSVKDFFLCYRSVMISFGDPITVEELFKGFEKAAPRQYQEIAREKVVKKIAELLDGHMKERMMRRVREQA